MQYLHYFIYSSVKRTPQFSWKLQPKYLGLPYHMINRNALMNSALLSTQTTGPIMLLDHWSWLKYCMDLNYLTMSCQLNKASVTPPWRPLNFSYSEQLPSQIPCKWGLLADKTDLVLNPCTHPSIIFALLFGTSMHTVWCLRSVYFNSKLRRTCMHSISRTMMTHTLKH